MPGKAKKALLHSIKMSDKRKKKASAHYLRQGAKRVTNENKAKPKQRQPHEIPKGHDCTVKGYLRADKKRKQEQAMIRQEARNLRTTEEQLDLLSERTGRKRSSPEFNNMREVKRLLSKV